MITNKQESFVSLVVYIHNNEKEVKQFLTVVNDYICKNFENYEFICVNDDSSDRSMEEIKKFSIGKNAPTLRVIEMSYYQGTENSMNAGVDLAIGDFVFEFDTITIDYPIDLIMNIYKHSLEGYDIVSASPKNSKQVTSKLFYSIFNYFSNSKYIVKSETFRILSRRVINVVKSLTNGTPYRKAMYTKCGMKIDTIYYDNIKKESEKMEKQILRQRKSTATNTLLIFTDFAYKISVFFIIFICLVTISIGIDGLIGFIANHNNINIMKIIIFFIGLGISMLLILVSIVIKYLEILINMNFKKKEYSVNSVEIINNSNNVIK